MNQICLYSNGLGVFAREYTLENGEPLKIALPVPTQTLDEAIASIGVFGDVTLSEPPNFAPVNRTQRGIVLDPNDVVKDVARTLRGATVEIVSEGKTLRGKLAGLQEYNEHIQGETFRSRFRIVLFEESGAMRTLADESITSLKFTDPTVQAEIEKALQRAFEQVKPDSSFINLTLTPNSNNATDAVVQYALANMGAWKIGYRLRCTEGKWELEGQAVVDNSTDDAWDDVLISVVSGQPISFATDIAEIRPVQRSKVNIVDDTALGNYEMADALYDMGVAAGGFAEERERSFLSAPAPAMMQRAMAAKPMKRAEQETAEVKETSEVVEYTAKSPISLAANQSAVIPMFSKELSEAKKLLVYNENQHKTRAYRAVEFVNEAGHGLGRGVVTLFDDGMYIGKAVLKETGKGEKQILPYALEPRIIIKMEQARHHTHTTGLKISRGIVLTERRTTTVQHAVLANPLEEAFLMEVEHPQSEGVCVVTLSSGEKATLTKTENGVRVRFTLPAKETLRLELMQTQIHEQSVRLDEGVTAQWFAQNIFAHDKTLADNLVIQECIALQKERDGILEQMAEIERAVKVILDEQERLKSLIKVGGLSEDMEEWRRTLATNERTIKEQKQRIPELNAQADAVKHRLMEAYGRLTVSWKKGEE